MPVALVVLDAFPFDGVDATTPTLAALAAEGGRHPDGGIGELTAATYPNHISLVNGLPTGSHGVIANRAFRRGRWTPAEQIGPGDHHLLAAASAAGLDTAFVAGDQKLVGVCGGRSAGVHWPPDGVVPDGAERNLGGYLADDEVVGAADDLEIRTADLVIAQLDAVDAAQHAFGPSSEEAAAQRTATDAALGALLEPLRSTWSEWLVIVVSDHCQEDLSDEPPLDLAASLTDRLGPAPTERLAFESQGTAGVVVGDMDTSTVLATPGVIGAQRLSGDTVVYWGGPGRYVGTHPPRHRGDHGSPRTRSQLCVIGGGHPAVGAVIGEALRRRPPVTMWAGLIAEILGVEWRPEPNAPEEA